MVLYQDEAMADYALDGLDTKRAIETGLADADWYRPKIDHDTLRDLSVRSDVPYLLSRLVHVVP